MAKITDYPSITTVNANTVLLADGSSGTGKILASNMAKYAIETYAGSTLAGSAQSVKSAVNAFNDQEAIVESEITNIKEDLKADQNGYSYLFNYGTFVNGTLYYGELRTNVKYRVATTSILQFDYDITLNVSDNFKFGVHLFDEDVFSSDTGWHTTSYTIPANTQFKPVIARRTENTSETADISEFVKQITFKTEIQNKIEFLSNSTVRYDILQAKTDAQKLQARNNAGSAGITSLAPAYSVSSAYNAGDIVAQGGKLYKCISTIATAEPWTVGHWQEVIVESEITNIKEDLKDYNAYNKLSDLTHRSSTHNNVTWAWNNNDCLVTGTATATENNDFYSSSDNLPDGFIAGGSYSVIYNSNNINFIVYAYSGTNLQMLLNTKISGTFTIPENATGMIIRLNIPKGVSVNETVSPCILTAPTNVMLAEQIKNNIDDIMAVQNGYSYLWGYSAFENGSLSSGVINKTVKYRVSSSDLLEFPYPITLAVSDIYKIGVNTFENSEFVADSGWKTGSYTIPANTQFKLIIAKRTEDTSEIADISEFVKQVTFKTEMQQRTENNAFEPVKYVSHQGNTNGDTNHNKVDGYIAAGLMGFNIAECDIKFTSDTKIVCCHDGSFADATTGETILISAHTLDELKTYDYYGGKIATLEEVIATCKKYGMILIIDQVPNGWLQVKTIFEIINKYRYSDYVRFLAYEKETGDKILSYNKTAHIICGQSYSSADASTAINLAESLITDFNKIDISLKYDLGFSLISEAIATLDPRIGVNLYTIDNIADASTYYPLATEITTNYSSVKGARPN